MWTLDVYAEWIEMLKKKFEIAIDKRIHDKVEKEGAEVMTLEKCGKPSFRFNLPFDSVMP